MIRTLLEVKKWWRRISNKNKLAGSFETRHCN